MPEEIKAVLKSLLELEEKVLLQKYSNTDIKKLIDQLLEINTEDTRKLKAKIAKALINS